MSPNQPTHGASLDLLEANTHSFIVKIWLEETIAETGQATWRGHITHVPDGERRYVKSLEELPAFIRPYLQQMGVKSRSRWQPRDWLRGVWRRLTRQR